MDKQTHMTIIFSTFVFLQWFNEINCRVVGVRDLNIFKNFFNNWIYILVMAGVFIFQIINVKYVFFLFHTIYLNNIALGKCIVWGATPLVISLLLKLTPEHWVERIPVKIDEDRAVGEGSIFVRTYESQAKATI